VLSRGEPTLLDAVRSLTSQVPVGSVEVVVSHSGPEEGLRPVREHAPEVRIDASAKRRLPGAARNAGVAMTTAPRVAFLAADCIAEPGWVEGRLRRHRAGAAAVASAMATPAGPPAALASHLLQHSTRMAHVRAAPHLRFGLSYARDRLAEHGPFDEDVEGEEDVLLNARLLRAGVDVVFAPDVLTRHHYPQTLRVLVRDQHARGRRRYAVRGASRPRLVLTARALADAATGGWRALGPGTPVPRRAALRCLPHLVLGALATAAGVCTGRRA
jgi:GT2 family glycosyltransferase